MKHKPQAANHGTKKMNERKTPAVPVMGTLIVNGVHWLRKLIASVDHPVEEFVIINNNGRGQIDAELDELVKEPHEFIRKMRVVHMPGNIGVAGGWNLIIKSYMMRPYWFIVSHDIEFSPGLVRDMVDRTVFQPSVGMIHISVSDRRLGSYESFIIKDWVVAQYGLFDENCYPAYQEDVEYILRSMGVRWDASKLPYKHGGVDSVEYSTHYALGGGQTVKEEPELQRFVDRNLNLNEDYLTRRWGGEWWHTYTGHIDNGHIPWNLTFNRQKYLGF